MIRRLLTNHPLVNILFVVVLVMGALAYLTMPREQDPEINFNWVNITTVLPGAAAADVEELVTGPLEDAIGNVQDIKFVVSNTQEGVVNILVRFRDIPPRTFDKRINDLRREVQNKTNEELPDEVEDPRIVEVTSSNGFPTAFVLVRGQAYDEQLRRTARQVAEDLERLTGVDKVQELGLSDPELVVEFDAGALANRGLSATVVADTLRTGFRDTFAGKADVNGQEWLARIEGTTADPDELAQWRIAPGSATDRQIALDSIARIYRDREEATQLVSTEGQPAVSLAVTKVSFTNTLDLVERINAYVNDKNESLAGSGITLKLADDQTVQTREALSIMQRNAALGMLLVLGVCWLFLGIRISVMVTLGIGFSVAGTFWLLQVTNNTLNVSVLLGVVIVLGMLVDDAVVVVEAMYYRLQRGAQALDAALDSLREVGVPVTAAVMTTMAAFLPLMLLPGIVGKFMFIIPFVVTVGLAVSLIEAFWILPAHVVVMGEKALGKRHDKPNWRERWTHWVRIKYTKGLIRVMRTPGRFLAAGLVAFVLAGAAVQQGLVAVNFFTFDPIRLFYVNIDMPPDSTLEQTLQKTMEVEERVRAALDDGVARSVTSLAGVKFTEVEPLYGDVYGQLQVALNPRTGSVGEIVDSLRPTVLATPGDAELSFLELSGGPPTASPINVKVRSDDFDELRAAANKVQEIARKIPGAKDVRDNDAPGRAEYVLDVDHAAARQLGIDPGTIARLMRLHLDGEVVAFFRDGGEKVELRVRGAKRTLGSIEELLDDPIILPNGQRSTFRAVVDARESTGRGTIRHYNLRRAITVEGELDDVVAAEAGINTVVANDRVKEEWEKIQAQFPNTNLDFSGELDDINESLSAMGVLFVLGLGLIYLILAAQFRSYFQPFLIIVTVPMAFTGVVGGLFLTNNPISLYTLYGMIALTGIAVNAAIVLIDAANARIAAGMRPLHATVYAARRRVIPILMTTSTTIAGLFSLAAGLGGKSLLWSPVATSIVAGLLLATPMTLFVVPTLYRLSMKGHGPVD